MEQVDVIKELESGLKFRWIYEKVDVESLSYLSYKYNLPIKIIEVLVKRGIKNEEDLKAFLEAPLNKFINPFEMKDIEMAVQRVYNALKAAKRFVFMVIMMLME